MNYKKLIVSLSVIFIMSCSHTSGVLKLAKDRFSVSVVASPSLGGSIYAKKEAIGQANKYCEGVGKEVNVLNTETRTTNSHGDGSADITFECI